MSTYDAVKKLAGELSAISLFLAILVGVQVVSCSVTTHRLERIDDAIRSTTRPSIP